MGCNWVFDSDTGHSSVYENTHAISSRGWSEYEDFPMSRAPGQQRSRHPEQPPPLPGASPP